MNNESQSRKLQEILQTKGKIVLLCDFTGKIIFWKGDQRVLQSQSNEYLSKNILSFNFTLHSQLLLKTKLTHEIFQDGKTQALYIDLIKNQYFTQRSTVLKIVKHDEKRYKKYIDLNIKKLKAVFSCIYCNFQDINFLQYGKSFVNQLQSQTKSKFNQKFNRLQRTQQYDKLLMISIEQASQNPTSGQETNNLSRRLILSDIQYIKRKIKQKEFSQKNKTTQECDSFQKIQIQNLPNEILEPKEKDDQIIRQRTQIKRKIFSFSGIVAYFNNQVTPQKIQLNEEQKNQQKCSILINFMREAEMKQRIYKTQIQEIKQQKKEIKRQNKEKKQRKEIKKQKKIKDHKKSERLNALRKINYVSNKITTRQMDRNSSK